MGDFIFAIAKSNSKICQWLILQWKQHGCLVHKIFISTSLLSCSSYGRTEFDNN